MKWRKHLHPLQLLILLPSLIDAAPPAEVKGSSLSQSRSGDSVRPEPGSMNEKIHNTPLEKLKKEGIKGTPDAPVDGLDGKPHAGPFVETPVGDRKKEKTLGTEAEGKKGGQIGKKPQPLRDSDRTQLPPESGVEDGVMNDKNRPAPKEGTTGTEGGVSEKDKQAKEKQKVTGEKVQKVVEPPKELPPHPHEGIPKETTKAKSKDTEKESEKKGSKSKETLSDGDDDETTTHVTGLERPKDLPDKPHDIPIPVPLSSTGKDNTPKSPSTSKPISSETLIQPLHSFALSMTMILFSEVGDKTFLIAALMAMKHPRLLVFSAAFSALIAMTILSAVLGHAVPTLIPKRFTNFAAAGLFLVFGAKMLREGLAMSPDEGVSEEMKEVEMELEEKESQARRARRKGSISAYALEAGRAPPLRANPTLPSPPRSPSESPSPSRDSSPSRKRRSGTAQGLNNLFSLLLSPAWVQTFVMTFLGEWGDRSQIATIAMAAGQDYWWVTGGAVSGHACCTAAAVVGGAAIAGRVSLRVVTLGGAIAFLVFAVIYLAEALYLG
ncbi:MAG: hypothetical protein M1814_005112 [Vezdaea aestivalis]|nr:MAG: hypothetical protein M1814_005112 [Vezdaea aestivalis]